MKRFKLGTFALLAALLLPSGSTLAQDASPLPDAVPSLSPSAQELYDAFPVEVGGVLLADSIEIIAATDSDGVDAGALAVLSEAVDALGVSLDDVSLGNAATFGSLDAESGILIIALRIPGGDAETMGQVLLDLLTVGTDDEFVIDEAVVADRDTTRVSSAEDPEVAFYLYAGEDMAWMVAAPVQAELEEAISQLP